MFEFNYVPSFIGKLKDLVFLKIINVDETILLNKALEQAFVPNIDGGERIINKFRFESLEQPHENTTLDISRDYVKKLQKKLIEEDDKKRDGIDMDEDF